MMTRGKQVILAYSWAGDSIPYEDTSGLQHAFTQAPPDEREAAYQALRTEVLAGQWWSTYKGKIHGAITAQVQEGNPVTLVGIQGGPITQLEQREMPGIVDLIKADLRAQGLKPSIELDMNISDFARFKEKYSDGLSTRTNTQGHDEHKRHEILIGAMATKQRPSSCCRTRQM